MFSPSAMLSPQLSQPSLPFIQFDILFEQFTYDFNSFINKGPIKQLILLYDTYNNGLCLFWWWQNYMNKDPNIQLFLWHSDKTHIVVSSHLCLFVSWLTTSWWAPEEEKKNHNNNYLQYRFMIMLDLIFISPILLWELWRPREQRRCCPETEERLILVSYIGLGVIGESFLTGAPEKLLRSRTQFEWSC